MTIQEVQAAASAMALEITQLVQTFESSTGCIVHSLPVHPGAHPSNPVTVEVVPVYSDPRRNGGKGFPFR